MMKVVLKLELFDDKSKKKAMKTASGIRGVESISVDMKDKKLTVTGDIDPVTVVAKLRKLCPTEIVSVGPAKQPEKKKEEPKKEEPKKKEPKDDVNELIKAQQAYLYEQALPHYQYLHCPAALPPYHNGRGVEEDPNACLMS